MNTKLQVFWSCHFVDVIFNRTFFFVLLDLYRFGYTYIHTSTFIGDWYDLNFAHLVI